MTFSLVKVSSLKYFQLCDEPYGYWSHSLLYSQGDGTWKVFEDIEAITNNSANSHDPQSNNDVTTTTNP